MLIVGEPGLGKSRLIEEFQSGSRKPLTPGSNGAPRSSCRTRRSTQSSNGAGSVLVWMLLRNSVLPTSKTRWLGITLERALALFQPGRDDDQNFSLWPGPRRPPRWSIWPTPRGLLASAMGSRG